MGNKRLGLMAFEYINAETGDILDILEERTRKRFSLGLRLSLTVFT